MNDPAAVYPDASLPDDRTVRLSQRLPRHGERSLQAAPDSPRAGDWQPCHHADLLKSAGYATALAGQLPLTGMHPTLIHDCGFDEYRMWAYKHQPFDLTPRC